MPQAIQTTPPATSVRWEVILNPFEPLTSRRHGFVDWRPDLTARELLAAAKLELPADEPEMVNAADNWDPAGFRVVRSGEVIEADDLDRTLAPGDFVVYVPATETPVVAIAILTFIFDTIIFAAIAAAVGFVLSKLFSPPDPERTPEDEESGTYGWSGIRTIYNSAGRAIPVVLGEHGYSGLAIGQYLTHTLETDNAGSITAATSKLRLLILLSEGPIHSIGGIEVDSDDLVGEALPVGLKINKNAAANFEGVRAWVRLGNNDQEHIPGFEVVPTVYEVDLLVDQVTLDSGDTPVIDWSMAAAFDMPEEGDQVVVELTFTGGLYTLSGSNLGPETVTIQVAYTELDSFGLPTGPRVVPELFDDGTTNPVDITGAIQGVFPKTLPLTLYDPATFVPGPIGEAVWCRKDTGYLKTPGNAFGSAFTPTQAFLGGVTVEVAFQYIQGTTLGSPAGLERTLFSWADTNSAVNASSGEWFQATAVDADLTSFYLGGFAVKLIDSNASTLSDSVGFVLEGGNGFPGGARRHSIPGVFPLSNGNQNLNLLTVTIIGGFSFVTLRVYWNGVLIYTPTFGVTRITVPAAPFYLGSSPGATSSASGIIYDRVRVLSRALDATEVAASANAPVTVIPYQAVTGTAAASLVAAWSLNVADLSGSTGAGTPADPWDTGTFADISGNGEDLDIVSITSPTTDGGVEQRTGFVEDGPAIINPQAGKYRIEVQRLDVVENATSTKDKVSFSRLTIIEDTALQYPGRALLGLELEATDQLNNTRPNVLVPVKGALVPVWDGADPDNPTAPKVWSDSPGWCAAAAVTELWGLGPSGFGIRDLLVETIQEAADYQAELVDDLKAHAVLATVRHVSFTGDLATTYPDGALELVVTTVTEWPDHHQVLGKMLKLSGTAGGGAPAWAQTIIDGGPYEVVEINLDTTNAEDTLRVPWPDGLVSAPPSPTTWSVVAVIEVIGYEKRMVCNMVLDRTKDPAWDVIMRIANSGRSAPVLVGDKIALLVNKPRPISFMFTSANIDRGTFKLRAKTREEEFNTATFEILDKDQDWERDIVELQHSSLQDVTKGQNVRRKGFAAEGVTSRSQALRELRILLNSSFLLRVIVSFECAMDAAFVAAGRVGLITHDLPLWAFSGRVRSSASLTTFVIDREVVLAVGTTYYAAIRDQRTDDVPITEVTTAAGTYPAGSTITIDTALGTLPEEDAAWAIGPLVTATKEFLITNTGLHPTTMRREITAVEYDVDVFDETGFPELPTPSTQLRVPDDQGIPSVPQNLVASDTTGAETDTGNVTRGIHVSWRMTAEDSSRVDHFLLWLSEVDLELGITSPPIHVGQVTGSARHHTLREGLEIGKAYRVSVQPVGLSGLRPSLRRIHGAFVHLDGNTLTGTPPPLAVVGTTQGLAVTFTVTQPTAAAASVLELRRGGWVYGDRVAVIAGGTELVALGENWVALPAANDGRQDPTIHGRNRLLAGPYSDTKRIDYTPALDAFDTALEEESVEDAGWTSGGATLTNFVVDTSEAVDFVKWDAVSNLDGTWRSRIYDLGEERLVHVSFGFEADQVHARTWGEWGGKAAGDDTDVGGVDSWGGKVGAAWTWEGTLKPQGDLIRNGLMRVGIVFGSGADPGTNFVLYKPGTFFARSFKFELYATRPTDDFDIRITRAAISIRPLKGEAIDGGAF